MATLTRQVVTGSAWVGYPMSTGQTPVSALGFTRLEGHPLEDKERGGGVDLLPYGDHSARMFVQIYCTSTTKRAGHPGRCAQDTPEGLHQGEANWMAC